MAPPTSAAPSTSAAMSTDLPVYLVRGDDPVLTGDAFRELTRQLVGDDDPALAVEDLAGDDYEIAAVVEAAQTPPFFGDRRVVVARSIGRFSTQDVAPLLSYLADPLATTSAAAARSPAASSTPSRRRDMSSTPAHRRAARLVSPGSRAN
jgi:DNA polymerase III delta subunit